MALEGLENLNLNVEVTIFAPDDHQEVSSPSILRGRIFSKESDQSMVIHLSASSNSESVPVGKMIILFLAHDLGLYIFSATVTAKTIEGQDLVLKCENLQQVKCFHRRKSVRINVNVPASFSTEFDRSKVIEGTISNISVGGAQLETSIAINPDSILELVYQLENIGPVYMDGKVIRVTKTNDTIIHGIEFQNPDQYTIDGIARFIMAEQMRQKRLGLQVFKAFIFDSSVKVHAPTVFGILQYKNLDISALQGKKCNGVISELGVHGFSVECPLKLPIGSILEFSVELPKIGFTNIQAHVNKITMHNGKYVMHAEYAADYEKIRNTILEMLAKDFNLS
jgi:hypothetical protein